MKTDTLDEIIAMNEDGTGIEAKGAIEEIGGIGGIGVRGVRGVIEATEE